MDITLNVTSNKIIHCLYITTFTLMFFSTNLKGENYLIPKKNAYGSLVFAEKKHEHPGVYDLFQSNKFITKDTTYFDLTPDYAMSKNENIILQQENQVFLTLSVESVKKNIIAIVNVYNAHDGYLYIYKKNIPYNGKDLCDKRFLITSYDVILDYLGGWCNYGLDMSSSAWLKIPPKSNYTYQVNLNDYYVFLPGKHRYNVGTFEHLIVRSNWFRNENINTAMFNILNQSHPKKKIDDLLYNLDLYGARLGVFLRSNEVSLLIDGDELDSLYSK